jgi:seryl-tRNA synthetase
LLDIAYIRNHSGEVRRAIETKGIDLDLDHLLKVEEHRRGLTAVVDDLRHARKTLSASIGRLPEDERNAELERARALASDLREREAELARVHAAFNELMLRVPNVPAPEVPVGRTDGDNIEVRRWGSRPAFDFEFKDHLDLAMGLGMAEVDRTRQFAGSRSLCLVGFGARLELAVLRFALDTVVGRGWVPVVPPVMVREHAMLGTGFFPVGREEAYRLEGDDLFLVGTSEVALVSMHGDSTLRDEDLPLRYAGISSCFRREAGAAGKDTRGFYRVHQFQKVEQVSICAPDDDLARAEHEALLANAEEIVQGLELPYRVTLACTGETGLGQIRKHELETWMPSRQAYAETHSCSTLGDFQARRFEYPLPGFCEQEPLRLYPEQHGAGLATHPHPTAGEPPGW